MVVGMRLQEEGEWEVMGERECDGGEMRRGCESERERGSKREETTGGREGSLYVGRALKGGKRLDKKVK